MKLGDRMKSYESRYDQRLLPMVPVLARLDGRAFHSFTSGLDRPFHKGLVELMIRTTEQLVEKSNARCGYTQSDEITLVWLSESFDSEIFFGGRLQKMCSVLSSCATAIFNESIPGLVPEKAGSLAEFDCRVWQVPTRDEAANAFVWREQDAVRNSIQSAARSIYSDRDCFKKSSSQLQDMLHESGVNWNDYPTAFKRGTYVRFQTIEGEYTAEQIEQLPPLHEARQGKTVRTRRLLVREEFEPITHYRNRDEVLLDGAEPIRNESESE